MDNNETDYRNKEKNARLELAHVAGGEANVTSRTTSGQLLLIAGAILTFSSSVIASSYTAHLGYGWKKLLVLSWVLFALSALIGVVSLFIDYYFFRKWHDYHFAVGEAISSKVSPDKAAKLNKDKKPTVSTSIWPLAVQSLLIIAAATIFLIVVSHVLLTS